MSFITSDLLIGISVSCHVQSSRFLSTRRLSYRGRSPGPLHSSPLFLVCAMPTSWHITHTNTHIRTGLRPRSQASYSVICEAPRSPYYRIIPSLAGIPMLLTRFPTLRYRGPSFPVIVLCDLSFVLRLLLRLLSYVTM